jgi:hypothetical protein
LTTDSRPERLLALIRLRAPLGLSDGLLGSSDPERHEPPALRPMMVSYQVVRNTIQPRHERHTMVGIRGQIRWRLMKSARRQIFSIRYYVPCGSRYEYDPIYMPIVELTGICVTLRQFD